jgi:hypothetical protein
MFTRKLISVYGGCRCVIHEGIWGKERYSSTHSSNRLGVNGKLHGTVVSPRRKDNRCPLNRRSRGPPQPRWTIWSKEKSLVSAELRTPSRQARILSLYWLSYPVLSQLQFNVLKLSNHSSKYGFFSNNEFLLPYSSECRPQLCNFTEKCNFDLQFFKVSLFYVKSSSFLKCKYWYVNREDVVWRCTDTPLGCTKGYQ